MSSVASKPAQWLSGEVAVCVDPTGATGWFRGERKLVERIIASAGLVKQ